VTCEELANASGGPSLISAARIRELFFV